MLFCVRVFCCSSCLTNNQIKFVYFNLEYNKILSIVLKLKHRTVSVTRLFNTNKSMIRNQKCKSVCTASLNIFIVARDVSIIEQNSVDDVHVTQMMWRSLSHRTVRRTVGDGARVCQSVSALDASTCACTYINKYAKVALVFISIQAVC